MSNLLYVLLLILWEPVYVACGFTLYLNRRTALEAWDIELTFRRLRQRLTGSAYALLLGCALLLTQVPNAAWADTPPVASEEAEQADPQGPDAPRLLKQQLSSQAARESIEALLDEPPFQHRETVTRWRLGEEKPAEEPKPEDVEAFLDMLKNLLKLGEWWKSLDVVAQIFEVLLWATLAALLVFVLWRYREWLQAFGERIGLPTRRRPAAPQQLFGLELAPETLPDDVASEAERLWAEQPRAALGLLYRALLSRLLHEHRLPLKQSHTEGEVLHLVAGLGQQNLENYSRQLTLHWQALAYGHRLPAESSRQGLCQGWRSLFGQERAA